MKTGYGRFCYDLSISKPRWQHYCQMHACLSSMHLQQLTKLIVETADQSVPAFPVKLTHSPEVPSKMPHAHEVSKHFLVKVWWEDVHSDAHRDEPFHQVRRNNDVANSQRR